MFFLLLILLDFFLFDVVADCDAQNKTNWKGKSEYNA